MQRHFADFDAYWQAMRSAASVRRAILALDGTTTVRLKTNLLRRFGIADRQPFVCEAFANAVSGRVTRR